MLKLDLQFFGGRGASSGGGDGGATGGVKESDILSTTSLISERERQQAEVDDVLGVLSDFYDEYGAQVDTEIATMKAGSNALAYYSYDGVVAVNQSYFDSAKMSTAYAECVKTGFHPSNGSKSAMQAVVAHEMGHKLTADVATRLGHGDLHTAAATIVSEASKRTGKSTKQMAKSISGYAKKNHAETVAEAISDVYCNGSKASKASRSIVDVVNGYLKGGK